MQQEVTVTSSTPMPKGYGYLPRGIAYKTLHCRKLTREAAKVLYVVVDNKKTLGLRAPSSIISQVHQKANATLSTRRAAVQKRDSADISRASAELLAQFRKIPATEKELVLKHGFKKHSGRVGRTASIPLAKKVTLAAIAHIRHKHTEYDALLRDGEAREKARKLTWKKIEGVMKEWGFKDDLSWYAGGKKNRKKKKNSKRQDRSSPKIKDNSDGDSDYVP